MTNNFEMVDNFETSITNDDYKKHLLSLEIDSHYRPCNKYIGHMEGYIFKKDIFGTGYYKDTKCIDIFSENLFNSNKFVDELIRHPKIKLGLPHMSKFNDTDILWPFFSVIDKSKFPQGNYNCLYETKPFITNRKELRNFINSLCAVNDYKHKEDFVELYHKYKIYIPK